MKYFALFLLLCGLTLGCGDKNPPTQKIIPMSIIVVNDGYIDGWNQLHIRQGVYCVKLENEHPDNTDYATNAFLNTLKCGLSLKDAQELRDKNAALLGVK